MKAKDWICTCGGSKVLYAHPSLPLRRLMCSNCEDVRYWLRVDPWPETSAEMNDPWFPERSPYPRDPNRWELTVRDKDFLADLRISGGLTS
jgi:hypothetical protein